MTRVINEEAAKVAVERLEKTVDQFNSCVSKWQADTGLQVNLGWNFKDGKPLKILSIAAPVHLSKVDMEAVQERVTGSLKELMKDTERK